MEPHPRILDSTLPALAFEGHPFYAAWVDEWRSVLAECAVGLFETLLPERDEGNFPGGRPLSGLRRSTALAGMVARVLPTTVLPSAASLGDIAPGAFSRGGRHCLYGLNDALLAGWESVVLDIERLSERAGTLFVPCFTNECGCASALTVEWLLGKTERAAVVSFSGCGGMAALEEVLAALHVHGALPAANLAVLPELAAIYRRMGGAPITPAKAVIGEAIFYVESGIHVDGLYKSPDLYELFPPETVGRKRRIIMGKHSGKRSVMTKCAAFGLPVTEELAGRLLRSVKKESARRGTSIGDADFLALYSMEMG
jgi:homocitrate synthase NifV